MRRSTRLPRHAPALLLLVLGACPWFTDFKDAPRVEPWEPEFTARDSAGRRIVDERIAFRGNPQLSVPLGGTAVPGYVVSYQPLPATIDSMAGLPNPRPITAASLENGRKHYQINCAVCHGPGGAGNGLAARYGIPPINLLTPITQGRTDGYIFGMIRNGRGLMPTYNRIEEPDRWDVVNYVRALQGKAGAPADTSPAGYPGQNGLHVPTYTELAPTRPPPHNAIPGSPPAPVNARPPGAPAADTAGARAQPARGAQPRQPGARP